MISSRSVSRRGVFAADHDGLYPWNVTNSYSYGNESRVWVHFQVMSNELNNAKVLHCPADKTREATMATTFTIGTNMTKDSLANCGDAAVSYFVGLDSDERRPQTILAGDRNIDDGLLRLKPQLITLSSNRFSSWSTAIHSPHGNVVLGDGSAQQFSNKALQDQALAEMVAYPDIKHRWLLPK